MISISQSIHASQQLNSHTSWWEHLRNVEEEMLQWITWRSAVGLSVYIGRHIWWFAIGSFIFFGHLLLLKVSWWVWHRSMIIPATATATMNGLQPRHVNPRHQPLPDRIPLHFLLINQHLHCLEKARQWLSWMGQLNSTLVSNKDECTDAELVKLVKCKLTLVEEIEYIG